MRHHLNMITFAPVAQLDRVLVSEAKGRGFDSRRARQKFKVYTASNDLPAVQQTIKSNIK